MLLFGHIGFTLGALYLTSMLTKRSFSYQWAFVGSILPDVIDKPLGRVLLPLGSGRLIGHSMAFLLLLYSIGLWRRDLALSFATALHLIEDSMWLQPVILFWPLLGGFPVFEPVSRREYISGILMEYIPTRSPSFISEMAGSAIILTYIAAWMRRHLYGG